MRAFFDHAETHTSTCKTFWFSPEHPLYFTAGEFAEFYLPHTPVDSRGDKRWFTISSSPDQPLVGITVGFTDHRGSSFKKALAQLTPGSTIDITEPMGDFVVPKDRTIPLVFVGLGIGITPVISIVRWLADHPEQQRSLYVFHAVKSADDLLAPQLFEQQSKLFVPIIRSEAKDTIDATFLLSRGKSTPDTLYYIAGPEQNVQRLANSLRQAGIDQNNIVIDLFTGAIELSNPN